MCTYVGGRIPEGDFKAADATTVLKKPYGEFVVVEVGVVHPGVG
jgi:hypothetical protein